LGNISGEVNIQRKLFPIAKYVLEISVLTVVCWYALHLIDWNKLHDIRIDFRWLTLGFAFNILLVVMNVILWQAITVVYSVSISWNRAVVVYCSSLIGKYVPTKVAMVVLRVLAYRRYGHVSSRKLVFCCYLEWVLGVYSGLLVAYVLAVVLDVDVGLPHFRLLGACLLVGIVFAYWVVIRIDPNRRFFGKLGREISQPRPQWLSLLALLLGYSLCWIVLGSSLFCIARSVIPISYEYFWHSCLVYTFSTVAGILSFFAPVGLGVRDGFVILLFSRWIDGDMAVVVSVLARIVYTLTEFIAVGSARLVDRSLPNLLAESADGEAKHGAQ